jgi:NAD(P)H-hydrate repair Nnr-like enzyme with NAD(P)H-hydrate dehydratase domain
MERSAYTARLSNHLLKKYPEKKWVIDAGALQMVNPDLLNSNCIITPHQQEIANLTKKDSRFDQENYQASPTCLLKDQLIKFFLLKIAYTKICQLQFI